MIDIGTDGPHRKQPDPSVWQRSFEIERLLLQFVAIAGLAWAYLFSLSKYMSGMEDMPGMAMSSGPAPFSLTATMWAVMMVGMMLPSALPMILLFTMVQRRQGDKPVLMTATFAAGISADLAHFPPRPRRRNRAWE